MKKLYVLIMAAALFLGSAVVCPAAGEPDLQEKYLAEVAKMMESKEIRPVVPNDQLQELVNRVKGKLGPDCTDLQAANVLGIMGAQMVFAKRMAEAFKK